MEGIVLDLRFALRSALRRPAFTSVAVLTLALGVGSTTAIFSVVNGVLLRPLPYPDPGSLVAVWTVRPERGVDRGPTSWANFADWRAGGAGLRALAAHRTSSHTLTGLGEAEVVPVAAVTAGFFGVFGEPFPVGRGFLPEEDVTGGPAVVVVSHAFWRGRLGGTADAVGRTVELDGAPHAVVGVAPEGFDFPGGARLWRPLQNDPASCGRACETLEVVGRLAPGATVARADQELAALSAAVAETYPDEAGTLRSRVVPLREVLVGDVRPGLLVLLGAVVVFLLVACANVANLLLVRGAARGEEMAVRAALGAERGRIASQLLTESALLGLLGGGVGLLAAVWVLDALRTLYPVGLARLDHVSMDGTVLLFALGMVLVTTLLFGLGPAVRTSRGSLAERIGRGGRPQGAGGWARTVLLVGQVAVSLVLLAGAGLLLRSFLGLRAVDLGFDHRNLVTFSVTLPEARYPTAGERLRFLDALGERLGDHPDVVAAAGGSGAPLGSRRTTADFRRLDRPEPLPDRVPAARWRLAAPGYLETLGVPLITGRLFQEDDRLGAPGVAVVNRAFVERWYPGEDAVGKKIRVALDAGFEEPERTIVGMVDDVRADGVRSSPVPELWIPYRQKPVALLTWSLRTREGAADRVLAAVRGILRGLDPDLPARRLETMADRVDREMADTRFFLALLALFAVSAVALAAVGLYGVVALVVRRRTPEIGVRQVLGARAEHVVRMVARQGLVPAAAGLAAGVAGALAGSRLLAGLLWGVRPRDPSTLVAVTVLVAAVVVGAVLLPARRATRIPPSVALRDE